MIGSCDNGALVLSYDMPSGEFSYLDAAISCSVSSCRVMIFDSVMQSLLDSIRDVIISFCFRMMVSSLL